MHFLSKREGIVVSRQHPTGPRTLQSELKLQKQDLNRSTSLQKDNIDNCQNIVLQVGGKKELSIADGEKRFVYSTLILTSGKVHLKQKLYTIFRQH